ncbi:MAG: endolytic transglycosylase MltG [Bacteroidales bacterium]
MAKVNRKNRSILIISILLFICVLFYVIDWYITYKKHNISENTIVLIHENATYQDVLDSLKSSTAIINWDRFEKVANKEVFKDHFEAGRFLLTKEMSNTQIIRTICNNWQKPMNLILPAHIRTVNKLANYLGTKCEADSAKFAEVFSDENLIDSLGFNKDNFIALFIPNTYQIFWTIEPQELVNRFYKEYQNFWNKTRLASAQELKMTPQEIITLASIVVEESNYETEQPTIAGVYVNRLKRHMKIQADPTIHYILLQQNIQVNRILYNHLRIKSPYNTYKYRGLPPGPITIPTINAIDAVLNYQHHNYLYFCANPELDGTHLFSSTYRQHLKLARKFHKVLNSQK